MRVTDLMVLQHMISEHSDDVVLGSIEDSLMSQINQPFFDHGGAEDHQISIVVSGSFSDLWFTFNNPDRVQREKLFRLLSLAAHWYKQSTLVEHGGCKALYEYNSALVLRVLSLAFGSSQHL